MKEEPVFSLGNRWFTISVAMVMLTAAASILIGFVWLPNGQAGKTGGGLWDAICRAAGVVGRSPAALVPFDPARRPSDVVVTAAMMAPANALMVGHGATLAMQCTMCHGARGMSMAGSPNLAGQSDAMIYKQLRDFKAGHRQNVIMQPMVARLDDQSMRALAAYYAYLPRETSAEAAVGGKPDAAPSLVRNGAPMRGIAACASCHGAAVNRTATPHLEGQPQAYIEAQLRAFARGARRNDINVQMRNVASHMTAAEISATAAYYAAQ